MATTSQITYCRRLAGDYPVKVKLGDDLSPSPDGANTYFRTTLYPINASSVTALEYVTLGQTTDIQSIPSASFSVFDAENGVISLVDAPPMSVTNLKVPYYQWNYFSDSTVSGVIDFFGSVHRAAIDLLETLLSDPAGTFYKTYQLGDEMSDDGHYGIGRAQDRIARLWQEINLPSIAGSGDINWPQYFADDPMNTDPSYTGKFFTVSSSDGVNQ